MLVKQEDGNCQELKKLDISIEWKPSDKYKKIFYPGKL